MSLKEAVTNSLLMFVAATCVVLIVKAVSPAPAVQTPATVDGEIRSVAEVPSPTPAAADGVYVYYLHGNFRCSTCRTIEEYAEESVRSGFGNQLQTGQIQWRVVNYDEPENRQFAIDYEVAAPTVVLARFENGKRIEWEALPDVWTHAGNKRLFVSYVQDSLREFLGVSPESTSQAVVTPAESVLHAQPPSPPKSE